MVNTPTKAGSGLSGFSDISNKTKLYAVSEYRHTRGVIGCPFSRSEYFIIVAILDVKTITEIVIARGTCCIFVSHGRSTTYSNTATTIEMPMLNLFNALI